MYCSQCGASMSDEAKYCAACGAVRPAAVESSSLPNDRVSGEWSVRPGVVTLLAVLKLVQGAVLIFLAIVVLAASMAEHSAVAFVVSSLFLAVGGAAVTCGVGLLRLRPFGRHLQIAFSILGLIGFPLQTIVSLLILVYMFRPGARVLFSGKSGPDLSVVEIQHLRSLRSQNMAAVAIAIVAAVLIMIPLTGIMAAIAIPNFLNAVDRGKQKRSMADLRSLGVAIESYAVDHSAYPEVKTIAALRAAVEPLYIKTVPMVDGWGHPFQIDSTPTGYTIWSSGKDGLGSDCDPSVTTRFADEICFVNGEFVRYPTGVQR